MNVVISQSMLFPWVGLLEQVRLADVFVHYDDVPLSNGRSLVNRVQVRTEEGSRWMTVPLQNRRAGQRIDDVEVGDLETWRDHHLLLLRRSFGRAPYAHDALRLADDVFSEEHSSLAGLARASLMALVRYFGLHADTSFVDSKSMAPEKAGSDRIHEIVRLLGGSTYITGHGAARYLEHERFERDGVNVRYMQYRSIPYDQGRAPFDPFVTGLDLVAHAGPAGRRCICSETRPWRDFVHESA